jgi:DNA modification methylase
MPDESIDQCSTSPPYYALRFYDTKPQIWDGDDPTCSHEFYERKHQLHNGRGDAQKSAKYSEQEPIPDQDVADGICVKCGAWKGGLGLEPIRELFIEHLKLIFTEVFRILKLQGTCYVNIGDTYASKKTEGSGGSGEMGNRAFAWLKERAGFEPRKFELGKLKLKTLCRIPDKFCDTMEEIGFALRDRIIWYKPNVMPESVTDRCTRSYEFVFMFVKDPQNYYYDQQREPYETPPKELVKYLEFDYEGQAIKDYEPAMAQDPSDSKRRIMDDIKANFIAALTAAAKNNDGNNNNNKSKKFGGNKIQRWWWRRIFFWQWYLLR